ncbi:class I SAM-dependent methyltransferase [Natronobiforma cellulositropha]|uniref:class I SAM-dependent methyltransferase n=1 Tax=Natronobiforma cellulositropha TaxID=1679076 RepID=UPI0021D59835|nr:class I SAM-dependent methyltransferase [Natronobiforma cellulositropha]
MVIQVPKYVYNRTIRGYLPLKYRVLAGVAVRDQPLFDITDEKSDYKKGLINAIHERVGEGDTVELVGFGRGVSTVHALESGAAHVTAYDGSASMIRRGTETLETNWVNRSSVDVVHTIVGDPIGVYGEHGDVEVTSPSELSSADVLVLDCEGAEQSIISGLGTLPETILCETHPERGVPTRCVVSALDDRYDVSIREYKPDDTKGKNVVVASLTE